MVGQWQDGKGWYRHLRRRGGAGQGPGPARRLNGEVFSLLEEFRMPQTLKQRILEEVDRRAAASGKPELERLHEELRRHRRRPEAVKEMRIEGEIDATEYRRRKEEIGTAIAEAEARLGLPPNGKTTRNLLAQIDQVVEVIAGGTLEQQKAVMNTLFERMEQRNGQIERFVLHSWARGLPNDVHPTGYRNHQAALFLPPIPGRAYQGGNAATAGRVCRVEHDLPPSATPRRGSSWLLPQSKTARS